MSAPRLLVADDDRLVLSTVCTGLRRAGYLVNEALSGEAALDLARREPFDLALVDIRMPGMSGIELAQQLRAVRNLPAVFLTAFSDTNVVRQALAEGALGYLVKPVDVSQLVPAIEAALARAQDIRELTHAREQLQQALSANRETSTAVGILMARERVDEKTAFEGLRAFARSRRLTVESVASDLVRAENTLNAVLRTRK